MKKKKLRSNVDALVWWNVVNILIRPYNFDIFDIFYIQRVNEMVQSTPEDVYILFLLCSKIFSFCIFIWLFFLEFFLYI